MVTADPAVVAAAQAVVLPGVGAAAPTMARLREFGLVRTRAQSGTSPDDLSSEFAWACNSSLSTTRRATRLAWVCFSGTAKRFTGDLKVPHMGWNRVYNRPHPMFEGIEKDLYFYYVHSYYVEPEDAALVVGATEYGTQFCGSLARGSLWGTQFHPEKSGNSGLRLLRNFAALLEAA